jgi:hypothetical protein
VCAKSRANPLTHKAEAICEGAHTPLTCFTKRLKKEELRTREYIIRDRRKQLNEALDRKEKGDV